VATWDCGLAGEVRDSVDDGQLLGPRAKYVSGGPEHSHRDISADILKREVLSVMETHAPHLCVFLELVLLLVLHEVLSHLDGSLLVAI